MSRRRLFLAVSTALLALLASIVIVAIATGSGPTEPYTTYEATVGADGPATQYRFDELAGAATIRDSVGTRNATPTSITFGATGPFGGSQAGSFNGTGSFATMLRLVISASCRIRS